MGIAQRPRSSSFSAFRRYKLHENIGQDVPVTISIQNTPSPLGCSLCCALSCFITSFSDEAEGPKKLEPRKIFVHPYRSATPLNTNATIHVCSSTLDRMWTLRRITPGGHSQVNNILLIVIDRSHELPFQVLFEQHSGVDNEADWGRLPLACPGSSLYVYQAHPPQTITGG